MSEQPNLRILIIDDNQEIHKDFIKILTKHYTGKHNVNIFEKEIFDDLTIDQLPKTELPNFEIQTASQGREGVDLIAAAIKAGKPYALAFVDIRMPPGWDGIETIKHIWAIDPDVQIVICTAYSDYSWEETVAQLGETENLLILKKPFDNIAVRQLSVALTKKWQLAKDSRGYTSLLEERVKERTTSLQNSLSITRGTLESSVDGILVLDKGNNIIDYNNKLIEILNISKSVLKSKNGVLVLEFISKKFKNSEKFLNLIKTLYENPDLIKTEKFKCKNNQIIELYSQPYFLKNKSAGRICNFRDITQRVLLEEKIQYQATHDALTLLPNRILLLERIQQEISKSKIADTIFSVLFFDLDRFKLVNDSFSHSAGDELLKNIANRVESIIRNGDILARLGGDEFVAIVTSAKNENAIKLIGTKILRTFDKAFKILNHNIVMSPSIGISIYPKDGKTVDELMRHADLAMYHAKEFGGNKFNFYTPELELESFDRLQCEEGLHHAIANEEFFLCYQPQYDITNNKLTSIEALIRWQHPEKGIVLPIDFIPLAEETGLIIPIGEWVLKKACSQNKIWQEKGFDHVRIAVNIGTSQFKQPNFVAMIKNALNETGLKPEYLELELTENIIIANVADASDKISQLRNLGIQIALDDFGTGYSSLNHLRTMHLDRLKIDRTFIQNIDINRDDEVIIQAIITMAKNLNLHVLAEGVETQKQLDFLKAKKCGEIQGFYFSKPLTSTELENLFENPVKFEPEVV